MFEVHAPARPSGAGDWPLHPPRVRARPSDTMDRMPSTAPADLFAGALDSSFVAYRIGRSLRAAWRGLSLVEGDDGTFDLDGFVGAGHATRTESADVHLQLQTRWNAPFLVDPDVREIWTPPYVARASKKAGDGSLSRSTANGLYEVRWEGQELIVAVA